MVHSTPSTQLSAYTVPSAVTTACARLQDMVLPVLLAIHTPCPDRSIMVSFPTPNLSAL